MKALISRRTLLKFREFLSEWAVLRTIEEDFGGAGIPCRRDYTPPGVDTQRRTLIEQYYAGLDLTSWADVCRLLEAYESVLSRYEDEAAEQVQKLIQQLERDGFLYKDGRLLPTAGTAALPQVKALAHQFDAQHLAQQVARMEEAIAGDPALAIGTAKEMLETVCKTILAERQTDIEGSPDVSQLVKQTFKELSVTREDVSDNVKGADTVRRMLSNLASIVQGMFELRNLHGSGHGRDGRTPQPTVRWAKLAVGASAVVARFLFETHQAKKGS